MRALRLALPLALLVAAHGAAARTMIDAVGRSVEVPDRIERVYAAGPPASATIYVVAPDRLIGWTRAPSDAAKTYLPQRYAELPVVGRLTGSGGSTDIDRVKQLAPDLILDIGTVSPRYRALAERVQRDTGIPYLLLDGSLRATPSMLRGLGDLLGVPERGAALAAWAERALAETGGRDPGERRRAYFGRGEDGLETGGAGFINVESLEAAGLINVAAELGSGWQRVTPAQVALWQPDLIVTEQPDLPARLAADPAWSAVGAIAAGGVHVAPSAPFGWIEGPPGPNRLLGLYWLHSLGYPGEVGIDLGERTREFYRLFYDVTLTPDRLRSLLGETAPATGSTP
ncbi:MAG: ABC transporter substrate-binding protein [Geminicoccaceae bacterium]